MDETPRAENPSYILCLSTPAPLVSLCTNPNTKTRSEIAIAIQRVSILSLTTPIPFARVVDLC